MELIVDVGNSYTKFGYVEKHHVVRYFAFQTNKNIPFNKLKYHDIDQIIISSVVKKMTLFIINNLKKYTSVKIIDIANIKKKLNVAVNCPTSEIGSDLYADLIGAINLYHSPLLIFDIGTVSKVLALDEHNTFIGASFFAGPEGAARSMFYETDKLPEIKLTYADSCVGKSTTSCINNGILYSLIYSINGFIESYRKILGKKMKVIITGGGASLIKPILKDISYNTYLTILGTHYIALEK